MDHYIDITLRPDPEFMPTMLMGALFNKLHRILAAQQSNRIGVSFPQYQRQGKRQPLADCLRLHGEQAGLQQLMAQNWLSGMADHIELTPSQPVPDEHQHIQVRRRQCKSNVERLRSRHSKRHGVGREAAVAALPDEVEQRLDLPFVMVKSSSSGQLFRLFISQTLVETAAVDTRFNCYGLGIQGTVPWF